MDIKLRADKWVTNNKDIKITDTDDGIKIEYFSDKPFEYIHYENIRVFSKYSHNDLFDIKENSTYEINFIGYTEGNIEAYLFINTYSKESILSNNSIILGSKKIIDTFKNTISYKVAIRVSGKGCIYINKINIDMVDKDYYFNKAKKEKNNEYLVLTNNYPSYADLYKNGFVHSRVRLYKAHGIDVDVYALKPKGTSFYNYEFEGINVCTGDYRGLEFILNLNKYKKILIHFVNSEMIKVINRCCKDTPLIIWLHGAEVSKWSGRKFNYTEQQIKLNQKKWDRADQTKMAFMRSIYQNNNYKFIVVSDWFRREVCEKDAECKILNYEIIPNVVNSDIFKYKEKEPSDRLKILSIRPYASNKYANDLTMKAILELSNKPFFKELEFSIYGKGDLFKTLTSQVEHFDNVKIYNSFLTHDEISKVHKEHGIFICPTRLDSQGVSMCEAMSSGLVSISNDVSAISEYLIDKECGILAKENDYIGLANAIEYLYYNPNEFLRMSKNASIFIENKCGIDTTIIKEIKLIEE